MSRQSSKENIDYYKKLPPLGNRNVIPRIHLDRLKQNESPPRIYTDSFVSINIQTSKSPTFREQTMKSTETLMESTVIQRNFLCSGCSISPSSCEIY